VKRGLNWKRVVSVTAPGGMLSVTPYRWRNWPPWFAPSASIPWGSVTAAVTGPSCMCRPPQPSPAMLVMTVPGVTTPSTPNWYCIVSGCPARTWPCQRSMWPSICVPVSVPLQPRKRTWWLKGNVSVSVTQRVPAPSLGRRARLTVIVYVSTSPGITRPAWTCLVEPAMSHTTLATLAVLFVVSDSVALVAIVAVVVSISPSGNVSSG
jgi:hypothetical protein